MSRIAEDRVVGMNNCKDSFTVSATVAFEASSNMVDRNRCVAKDTTVSGVDNETGKENHWSLLCGWA